MLSEHQVATVSWPVFSGIPETQITARRRVLPGRVTAGRMRVSCGGLVAVVVCLGVVGCSVAGDAASWRSRAIYQVRARVCVRGGCGLSLTRGAGAGADGQVQLRGRER